MVLAALLRVARADAAVPEGLAVRAAMQKALATVRRLKGAAEGTLATTFKAVREGASLAVKEATIIDPTGLMALHLEQAVAALEVIIQVAAAVKGRACRLRSTIPLDHTSIPLVRVALVQRASSEMAVTALRDR
jgi:hypothetical protein